MAVFGSEINPKDEQQPKVIVITFMKETKKQRQRDKKK